MFFILAIQLPSFWQLVAYAGKHLTICVGSRCNTMVIVPYIGSKDLELKTS